MNETNKLDPMDAWADFWEAVVPTLSEVPNELHVAQSTWRGAVFQKSGTAKTLGIVRVKRLLDKYAPGRYRMNEATFTKIETE